MVIIINNKFSRKQLGKITIYKCHTHPYTSATPTFFNHSLCYPSTDNISKTFRNPWSNII